MSDTQPAEPTPAAEPAGPYDARKEAKERLVCPRCEAKPGDSCVSVPSGNPTSLHSSRVEPLEDAYAAGRAEGGYPGMAEMTAVPSQPRAAGDVPVTTAPVPQPTSPPLS